LSYFNPTKGMILVVIFLVLAELFIEYTGMVNPKFHPFLSLINRLTGWPRMVDGEDPVDTKQAEERSDNR